MVWCMCAKESRSLRLIYCAFFFSNTIVMWKLWGKLETYCKACLLLNLMIGLQIASFRVSQLCQQQQQTYDASTETHSTSKIKSNLARKQCFLLSLINTCIVVDWFWDPVEEEACAEPTWEEHAEPEVCELVRDAQRLKAQFPPPQVWRPALAAILKQFRIWKSISQLFHYGYTCMQRCMLRK